MDRRHVIEMRMRRMLTDVLAAVIEGLADPDDENRIENPPIPRRRPIELVHVAPGQHQRDTDEHEVDLDKLKCRHSQLQYIFQSDFQERFFLIGSVLIFGRARSFARRRIRRP